MPHARRPTASPLVPSLLALSDATDPAGTPLLGALVHLQLPPAAGFFSVALTPLADGIGSLVIPAPIPANPALAGVRLAAQVASVWPAPVCGTVISTSRGLEITIQ